MDKKQRQAIKKGKKGEKGEAPPAPPASTAASTADKVADGLKKVAGSPEVQAKVKAVKEAKVAKEGALPPLPKMPSSASGARASGEKKIKPTRPCACGCGTETKSEWAPGHDARARGWALRIQRGILTIDQVPENERQGANLMLTGAAEGKIKLVHSAKQKEQKEQEGAAAEGTGTEG